jgi:AraC-like DNA-binding protein
MVIRRDGVESDTVAQPLGRFPVAHTSSLEEARDAVTRVYLPHNLESRYGEQLTMTLNAVAAERFTLGFLVYGAPTRLTMPATEAYYHINLTTRGRTFADRQDGTRAVTDAQSSGLILLPDQLNTVRWTADAEQLILRIPRSRLESHLADLVDHPVREKIDFDFGFDLTTPRGRSLLSAVEYMAREMERPGGIADMPLAREQLETFVLTQLVLAAPHPYVDELLRPADAAPPSRLKPVIDYMEMNADEPLTPQELARVGCMSVRTLHATFQQELGMSSMAYLRQIRLDHVRTELMHARRDPVRVTDIALRWGFLHPSRFAQQYRQRFGELPSDTLRRHANN